MISRFSKTPQLVQPSDLGLREVQKALTLKNAKIEQNYTAINANFDKLNKLDIIKGLDKDYLQAQLNKSMEQLNTIGDLSDIRNVNTANQLASGILDDKHIKSALVSTANIRNVLKQREAINTNPKLIDHKSSVNEQYDNDAINQYMKNGNIGESFSMKNATIGVNVDKVFADTIKSVEKTITETQDPNNPFLLHINEAKRPQDISSALTTKMNADPEIKAQMERNLKYGALKNPDQFSKWANDYQKEIIGTHQSRLDTLRSNLATLSKEDAPNKDTIEKYKTAIKNTEDDILELKGVKDLSPSDPDFQEKAFKIYSQSIKGGYAQNFSKSKDTTKVNAAAVAAATFGLNKEKFTHQKEQDNFNNIIKAKNLELDQQVAGAKIAKDNAEAGITSSGASDIVSSAPNDPVKLYEDVDTYKIFKESQDKLMTTNATILSDAVYRMAQADPSFAAKMEVWKKNGWVKQYTENGKTVYNQFLFSDAGLQQITAFSELIDATPNHKFSAQNGVMRKAIFEAKENNIDYKYNELYFQKILKKNNLTLEQFNEHTNSTFTNPLGETSRKVKAVQKELRNYTQSVESGKLVPLALLNDSELPLKENQINLRTNVINTVKQVGIHAKNSKENYSPTGYINGKEGKKIKNFDTVDFNKSFNSINPVTREVVFTFVDSKGVPVKMDEFPTGEGRVTVSEEMANALLSSTGAKSTSSQYTANRDSSWEKMKSLTDDEANTLVGGVTHRFHSLPSNVNINFKVKKYNDKYIVNIGDDQIITTNMNLLDSQMGELYAQASNTINNNERYKSFSVQQKSKLVYDAVIKQLKVHHNY